jgi:hypothetical protein
MIARRSAPGGGEQRAGIGAGGGGQPLRGGGALGVGPGGQGGKDRQALAGPLVHPGLALQPVFFVGGLAGGDRAADRVRPPPGRVVVGPFGDVEVKRADHGQHAAAIPAGRRGSHRRAGRAGPGEGPGHHPLFPRGGHVAGQLERADAQVVGLDVGPEQLAEQVGVVLQGGEVHRCLAFPQVVHEHVADWAALDVVAVDQLLAGGLSAAAEDPHRRGRVLAECAHAAQQLIEERAARVPVGASAHLRGGAQQLGAVAGGDAGRHAALGRHDDRDLVQRREPGTIAHRPGLAQLLQPGECGRVAGAGHLGGQVPRGG